LIFDFAEPITVGIAIGLRPVNIDYTIHIIDKFEVAGVSFAIKLEFLVVPLFHTLEILRGGCSSGGGSGSGCGCQRSCGATAAATGG